MMTSVTFAQFSTKPVCRGPIASKGVTDLPTWTPIDTVYSLTDINGNTINLPDTLAAGKALIIDYSATWCSWCWVMHSNGILEALQSQLGDDVSVMWIEADASTPVSEISGGGSSQGDWTAGVTYPIIDNANSAAFIGGNITGFPTVVMITPSGYWCDLYDTDWGFGPYSASDAVTAVTSLLTTMPAANTVPTVSIQGMSSAVVGSATTYTANIVSVDQVTDISWTITNGNPATASNVESVTTTWSATGNEQVILSVTNTTGTTVDTLDVNVFEWNWGDTMSYCGNDAYVSSMGAGGDMTWAVKFPASAMADRNYLTSIEYFSAYAGNITATVYQTTADAEPTDNDMLYQNTYAVTAAEDYITLPIYDHVALDDTKDLWVVFHSADITYPASSVEFTGDPNGSLIFFQNAWAHIYDFGDFQYTWMIKAITSETAPALSVAINGPASAQTGETVSFTVTGPAAATYTWSFEGGDPATATGNTVSTSYANSGTYTVSVTATLGDETATASTTITIIACDPQSLPFVCGFESNNNMDCWSFLDEDGDGIGWDLDYWTGSDYVHGGSSCAASASYINNYGAVTPDNWMITPQIVIPSEGATLNYYVGAVDASYFAEYYSVLVSTTGSATSNFTGTLFAGTVASVDYTLKSLDLSGYAGQTIRLAFRHHNITDMYWMMIDDIEVIAGQHAGIDNVREAAVELYPNPTTNVLNIEAEGVQEVSVIDINGRTVMSEKNVNVINMSNLANGVYYVRVITNDGVSSQKIVKK